MCWNLTVVILRLIFQSLPCLNGALCIDGLNNYTCDCTDTGYTGPQCELNIDDCEGNPCTNGAQCVDAVKDYHCNCYPGYEGMLFNLIPYFNKITILTGKNCQDDINECENNPCKFSGTCLEKSNVTLYNQKLVSEMNITLPESFNRPFDYAEASG